MLITSVPVYLVRFRDITPKELNLLIMFSTLFARKPKDVTVFKDSNSPTHLEEVLDLEWEPF